MKTTIQFAMNCHFDKLTIEHRVCIVRLINHLATHPYIYQDHAMRRIDKIAKENPWCDDIEGFEKLPIHSEDDDE